MACFQREICFGQHSSENFPLVSVRDHPVTSRAYCVNQRVSCDTQRASHFAYPLVSARGPPVSARASIMSSRSSPLSLTRVTNERTYVRSVACVTGLKRTCVTRLKRTCVTGLWWSCDRQRASCASHGQSCVRQLASLP